MDKSFSLLIVFAIFIAGMGVGSILFDVLNMPKEEYGILQIKRDLNFIKKGYYKVIKVEKQVKIEYKEMSND